MEKREGAKRSWLVPVGAALAAWGGIATAAFGGNAASVVAFVAGLALLCTGLVTGSRNRA